MFSAALVIVIMVTAGIGIGLLIRKLFVKWDI